MAKKRRAELKNVERSSPKHALSVRAPNLRPGRTSPARLHLLAAAGGGGEATGHRHRRDRAGGDGNRVVYSWRVLEGSNGG